MNTLYNSAIATVFALILYYGYGVVGGVFGTFLIGGWMIDWEAWSFVPLLLMGLAVGGTTGLTLGIPFGVLITSRPENWALVVSSVVAGCLLYKYYPMLGYAHYFEITALVTAFTCFGFLGFRLGNHLTRACKPTFGG